MRIQNPVADVNDVNILLDDDVAGENLVVHPVAQANFIRRSFGPLRPIDVAGEIVRFAANDATNRAGMDAADHFDKRRAVANLEADVEAEFSVGALANVDHFHGARNVHSNGLFQINVLTRGDYGFEML